MVLIIITKPADLCNIACYNIMLNTSTNVPISKIIKNVSLCVTTLIIFIIKKG
jgi:hypothetical protein